MKSIRFVALRSLAAVAVAGIVAMSAPALAATSGPAVKVGSTLALTGPLSATALIHKLVGEIYVEELNKKNGLLGRPVEWVVKDDQSKPDLARTLYEQLVTVDKVDLLLGPYATANILSAMGVAQRYNKILIHHTFGIPSLAKYEMQFPTWAIGADTAVTTPNMVFDGLAAGPKPPKTIAIVTTKFPSVLFMSTGAREVAKKRGLNEVLYLEWEFGNRDFGAIAARLKDAKPDFIWTGVIALEGMQLLDAQVGRCQERACRNHFRAACAVHEQHRCHRFGEDIQRARRQGGPARHHGRHPGRGVLCRMAGARGRGQRDQEPG